jgi:hypothetical protein
LRLTRDVNALKVGVVRPRRKGEILVRIILGDRLPFGKS